MPKNSDHYYLTTPIYYVNGEPHVGHAYTSIAADIMARFQRMLGRQVNFLSGTDEHGQKIQRAADAAGKSPQQFVDEISVTFRELHAALNISNTDFIRTTEERHITGAQKFWAAAAAAGDIYKKKYEGLYCVSCEQFYVEKDLVGGVCPIHNKPPELLQEENYFFRLSKYGEPLKKYFDEHPDFIFPQNRQKEMRKILEEGLEDISISRAVEKLSWGIPVPGDETQVMYVWFDALTNYVTAAGYGSDENFFNTWWPASAHLMGKEINRFHSLLWPAMLLSVGEKIPEKIVVHGWLTVDNQKMSKSLGNFIVPAEVVKKYGVDAFRYFLFREMSFGGDGDFSFTKLEQRYKSDLQNDLGNLVMRTVAMTEKYCGGVVPAVAASETDHAAVWDMYRRHMEQWEFQPALELVWNIIRAQNQLIDKTKPWALAKEGKTDEVAAVLYTVLETMRMVACALLPFIPASAEKILATLGYEVYEPQFQAQMQWGLLKEDTKLESAPALFPQLV